jgi:succinoglycan biosynthesis transport protein ExoP
VTNEHVGSAAPPILDLRAYLSILRARKWVLLAVAAVVFGATLVWTVRQTPQYSSRAEVLVQAVDLTPSQPGKEPTPSMDTESRLASSPAVAALVAKQLKTRESPMSLLKGLKVSTPQDTEILVFAYSDPDPARAQQRAQAFATAYLQFRQQQILDELNGILAPLQKQIKEKEASLAKLNAQIARATDDTVRRALEQQANSLLVDIGLLRSRADDLISPDALRVGQIVAPATRPTSPSSPKYPVNLALGLLVGLGLGTAAALLMERLDDSLRGASDFQAHLGAPVLAVIPKLQGWRKRDQEVLAALAEPYSPTSEGYRTLRAGLLFSMVTREARVVMVTSAHTGEGKTTTTANLGVVLAQAGKRVVLISADLRKPRLHRFFPPVPGTSRGGHRGRGLANLLAGEIDLSEALVPSGIEFLHIIHSGAVPGNHDALLGSDAMGRLLAALRESADVVLIDAPPVLGVADALTMAPLVDGVLFVAHAHETSRGAVREAGQLLEQVNVVVLGAVLNSLDPAKAPSYAYSKRYGHGYQAPAATASATEENGFRRIRDALGRRSSA